MNKSYWADIHIKTLEEGKSAIFVAHGKSMEPLILNKSVVTVAPIRKYNKELAEGDIVLCEVNRRHYLHLVKDIDKEKKLYQIGNNKGGINGWIPIDKIYGIKLLP